METSNRVILYCRYRQAWMWEDKTVDYYVSLTRFVDATAPVCSTLRQKMGHLTILKCGMKSYGNTNKYLCQTSDTESSQHTQLLPPLVSRQTAPMLPEIIAMTMGQDRGLWWPVICPARHLTHVFMACDVVTWCWARRDIAFSLHPQSWALPMASSCPVHPAMKPLPPSFPCRSETRRVPYSLVCNHQRDCLDSSDETFCTFSPCDVQTQFQCLNKQVCIFL